jgi:predicted RNA-binding Zn ribbon-like protein
MSNETAPKFHFVGGDLSLDFCNTMGGKRGAIPREKLHTFNDLVSWAEQGGLLQPEQAETLRRYAARNSVDAGALLTRAIELREALFRIFLAASEEKMPTTKDMAVLNAELAASLGRLRIGPAKNDGRFAWQWADEQLKPVHVLGPVARSAAELLVQEDLVANVHQCKGDNCGWLFIDCSKNHSRCWCDMRDCGNRAKVRRHRQKEGRKSTG